jgi:hypothetical protein
MRTLIKAACWAALFAACLTITAEAQQLITNGSFESGFTGWTRTDQVGSDSTWLLQNGTVTPVNSFTVPAPPGGTNAAMTDAAGPGAHLLYQDFVVPLTMSVATLSFDVYLNNHASAFFSPATLDFSTPTLNQQFRVDVITTAANPFSVTVADVLMSVYGTQPGNPLVAGYNSLTFDLSALFAAHPGETLRLRFAEVDNINFFNVGVDRVSIMIPEPGTVSLLVFGAGTLGGLLVRRRSRR